MSKDPLLSLENVVAGYSTPVVGPFSLALWAGEIVGLEGPNGAGKSTLLGAVTGAARIFQGGIRRVPSLRIAHQQQRFPRLPQMPFLGREFLRLLGATKSPIPDSLQPTLDRRLDELSGGQLQLLQVWACLGSSAQLVLLDEPTNNMDPQAMRALVEILRDVEPWRCVVVVSHLHDFVRQVCSRTVPVRMEETP